MSRNLKGVPVFIKRPRLNEMTRRAFEDAKALYEGAKLAGLTG